jgi:hypothetical protein
MSITHVLFVTDRSGSMYELAKDVRGGFNQQIEELRKDPEPDVEFRVSVTLFNHEQYRLCENVPLEQVPLMDEKNYATGGNTALFDAIGDTVSKFKETHPVLGEDKVLLVIQTDGEENASQRYNRIMIQMCLDAIKAEGWAVLYLGQGAEGFQGGAHVGTQSSLVANSSVGTRSSYGAVGQTMRAYSAGKVAADKTVDWFDQEYRKREADDETGS